MSNCLRSGFENVWVVEQYELHSLNEHLANGRPWDLDRTRGGPQVLPPFESGSGRDGFADGNADALFQQFDLIEEYAPAILLVLSADHVYKMDFCEVVEANLKTGNLLTLITTKFPPDENALRYGITEPNQARNYGTTGN